MSRAACFRLRVVALGVELEFASNSRELLTLAKLAFADLPRGSQRVRTSVHRITLQLSEHEGAVHASTPPEPRLSSAGGLFCAVIDASNYAVVVPEQRTALVVVSKAMLRFAYHVRYELIEFAVYMLVPRACDWVPLHAACVGRDGRGALLIGASGAGKSTLGLHCMLAGLPMLAEDCVFVEPARLIAHGAPNFLHLRASALHFVRGTPAAAAIRRSPIIRRRSGVAKYELDLRDSGFPQIAASPLRVAALVVVSARRARTPRLLQRLSRPAAWRQLVAEQPVDGKGAIWTSLRRALLRVPAFELRRGAHPDAGVMELRAMLAGDQRVVRPG